MSLNFVSLHQFKENFLVDSSAPVYIDGGPVSANDMACLAAWFEVIDATAGVTNLTPGTITIEYSPDDGKTWVTLPGMLNGTVEGNGSDWNIQATQATGIFPPLIRFKFIAPAGESYRVVKIRRMFVTPGLVAPLRSSSSGVPVTGFGAANAANRNAAMVGAPTVLPVPAAGGYDYVTTTAFQKTVPNDGRAWDVNIVGTTGATTILTDGTNNLSPYDHFVLNTQFTNAITSWKLPVAASLVGWDSTNNLRKELLADSAGNLITSIRYSHNGSVVIPTFDSGTPANNKGLPIIFTAGDALGPVTMGTGADSANTLRVTLSTRHETVTTPISARPSDGTNFIVWSTYAAAQFTDNGASYRVPVSAYVGGWDGANHREVSVDTSGNINVNIANVAAAGKTQYGSADVPLFWNFATGGQNLVANTWKQIVASTSANILRLTYWNPTGEIIELGVGAGGGEVSKRIFKIGDGVIDLYIPSGSRIALRCANAISSDSLVIDFIN